MLAKIFYEPGAIKNEGGKFVTVTVKMVLVVYVPSVTSTVTGYGFGTTVLEGLIVMTVPLIVTHEGPL